MCSAKCASPGMSSGSLKWPARISIAAAALSASGSHVRKTLSPFSSATYRYCRSSFGGARISSSPRAATLARGGAAACKAASPAALQGREHERRAQRGGRRRREVMEEIALGCARFRLRNMVHTIAHVHLKIGSPDTRLVYPANLFIAATNSPSRARPWWPSWRRSRRRRGGRQREAAVGARAARRERRSSRYFCVVRATSPAPSPPRAACARRRRAAPFRCSCSATSSRGAARDRLVRARRRARRRHPACGASCVASRTHTRSAQFGARRATVRSRPSPARRPP